MCFFFQAEDGIRDLTVTGVQTCALPILRRKIDIEQLRVVAACLRAVCTRYLERGTRGARLPRSLFRGRALLKWSQSAALNCAGSTVRCMTSLTSWRVHSFNSGPTPGSPQSMLTTAKNAFGSASIWPESNDRKSISRLSRDAF